MQRIVPGNLYSRLQRITTNKQYFPEIDGIRFLAIFLVFLTHVNGYVIEKSGGFTDNPALYLSWKNMLFSKRGVQLFFVLSGFILCLPFAQHYINKGRKVDLKRYYLRRVTRLEPPYFIAMVAMFFAALALGVQSFSVLFPSLLASLVYMHNIIFQQPSLISVVAWSLEIEIQFYLMAPLLFRILTLPKTPRRLILAIAAAYMVNLQNHYEPAVDSIFNHIQFFLVGILLADLYVSNSFSFLKKGWTASISLLFFAGVLFLPIEKVYHARLVYPFFIMGLYIIILQNDVVKKLFSYKFIPVIGGMCYSIYLLHYPIISYFGRFTVPLKISGYYFPNLLMQLVLLAIPVLSISCAFYYFIERPFMSSKWIDKLVKNKKSVETEMAPVSEPKREPVAEQVF